MVYCHGAVASEEAAMVTLRRRCSADLPTRQAVQMAREALRRGFVLPETVSHPAIDNQVMSLAYLLMAYGLVPEPRGPDRIITRRKSAAVTAIARTQAAAAQPAEPAPPPDYGADTRLLRSTGGNGDGAGNGYDMRDRSALIADETPPGRIHAMWHHALAIYLLIAFATEAVVVRLNVALMRSSDGRPGDGTRRMSPAQSFWRCCGRSALCFC